MFVYQYDPKRHVVVNLELGHWLRRHFRNDKIFVMHNRENKHWSVSLWVRERHGPVEDLVSLGLDPNSFDRDHVRRIEYLLNGPLVDPMRIIAQQKKREQDHIDQVFGAERDARRYLARTTGTPDPLGNT